MSIKKFSHEAKKFREPTSICKLRNDGGNPVRISVRFPTGQPYFYFRPKYGAPFLPKSMRNTLDAVPGC